MKVKKLAEIVFYTGVGSAALALLLTLLVLAFGGENLAYSGFTKFLAVFSNALEYASLAACILYAFVNFGMLNLVGYDYRKKELSFGRTK